MKLFYVDLPLAYMDDNFGFDAEPQLVWYEPYHTYFPAQQVQIFRLWDLLCIPHKKEKQLFGRTLTIIGFLVDAQNMTITLPEAARMDLVEHIRDFLRNAPRRRRPLLLLSSSRRARKAPIMIFLLSRVSSTTAMSSVSRYGRTSL